jgi:hypothetical protein
MRSSGFSSSRRKYCHNGATPATVSAKSVALIPRCAECEAVWLPADAERWRAYLGGDESRRAGRGRLLLLGLRRARVRRILDLWRTPPADRPVLLVLRTARRAPQSTALSWVVGTAAPTTPPSEASLAPRSPTRADRIRRRPRLSERGVEWRRTVKPAATPIRRSRA